MSRYKTHMVVQADVPTICKNKRWKELVPLWEDVTCKNCLKKKKRTNLNAYLFYQKPISL